MNGTGLEAVVKDHFGISLDKKYQKKDWSKRPLPPEMIDYAARDVMYLLPISIRLVEALKQKNRLEWVLEECAVLSGVRPIPNNSQPLFLKIKGAGRLSPRALAILEKILPDPSRSRPDKRQAAFQDIQQPGFTCPCSRLPRLPRCVKKK